MSVRAVKMSSNCAHVVLLVSTGFRHKEKSARCVKASRSSLTVTSLPFLVMFIRAELLLLSNAQESNAGRPHPAHTWLNSDLKNECCFGGENFFIVGLRAIRLTPEAHTGCRDCIRHLLTVHRANNRS